MRVDAAPVRIAAIFGTRPEAIKLAPVSRGALSRSDVEVDLVSTGQQGAMLKHIVDDLGVHVDHDIAVHTPGQTPVDVLSHSLIGIQPVLKAGRYDWVMVQGDTTSGLAGALAAFNGGYRLAHLEAGYRTDHARRPFPEEMNRRLVAQMADLHFASTDHCRQNLLLEGLMDDKIHVIGNTVVDALQHGLASCRPLRSDVCRAVESLRKDVKVLLVTMHRRENWGEGAVQLASALDQIVRAHPAVQIVLSVHPNPAVSGPLLAWAAKHAGTLTAEGICYRDFCWLIERSNVLLTDSGGLQEEAAALGRHAVVTRTETERIEAVEAGVVELVGTDVEAIVRAVERQLATETTNLNSRGLYGDGTAATQALDLIVAHTTRFDEL